MKEWSMVDCSIFRRALLWIGLSKKDWIPSLGLGTASNPAGPDPKLVKLGLGLVPNSWTRLQPGSGPNPEYLELEPNPLPSFPIQELMFCLKKSNDIDKMQIAKMVSLCLRVFVSLHLHMCSHSLSVLLCKIYAYISQPVDIWFSDRRQWVIICMAFNQIDGFGFLIKNWKQIFKKRPKKGNWGPGYRTSPDQF